MRTRTRRIRTPAEPRSLVLIHKIRETLDRKEGNRPVVELTGQLSPEAEALRRKLRLKRVKPEELSRRRRRGA